MDTRSMIARTASLVVGIALASIAPLARAQTAAPPPGYQDPNAPPPPEYAPPPPAAPAPPAAPPAPAPPPPTYPPQGYAPPPAGYPPSPGYAPPPPGYAPPPPAYPPPGSYPPPPGYGPPGYPPSTYAFPPPNAHDGFYLRLHLGGGFTSVSRTDSSGSKLTISGGSASFGAALGGVIAPNLIVFGSLFVSAASNPSATVDGVSTSTADTTASLGGVGGGLAYYVEPANVYVSGALAAMVFQLQNSSGDNLYESNTGIGLQAIVGKEWWLSSDWGVGVAGEFIAASMKDKMDSSITWTGAAFSILFSATYN